MATWREQQLAQNFEEKYPAWYRWAGVGGIICAAAFQHHRINEMRQTIPMSKTDFLAIVFASGGAALLASSSMTTKKIDMVSNSPTHSSASAIGSLIEFDFTVLNKRFAQEEQVLEAVVNQQPFWFPQEIQNLMIEAEREEEKSSRAQLLEKEKRIEAIIKQDMKELPLIKVLQKLKRRVYVVDFADYLHAIPLSQDIGVSDPATPLSSIEWIGVFRDTCSLLIQIASDFDTVVIRLSSPGGSVSEYGLASSHILRLRNAGITVVACIDTVCASGGYMMACCCDEIVAAPFALVGSIGVVAEIPNFSKLLKRVDIDYFLFTAGKFKRTVHHLAENSPEGIEKFQEQLDDIHKSFQDHVHKNRDAVDIEASSTGEAWIANEAKAKGLVDILMTSDQYLDIKETEEYDLIRIGLRKKKNRKTLTMMIVDRVFTSLQQASALPPMFQAKL